MYYVVVHKLSVLISQFVHNILMLGIFVMHFLCLNEAHVGLKNIVKWLKLINAIFSSSKQLDWAYIYTSLIVQYAHMSGEVGEEYIVIT